MTTELRTSTRIPCHVRFVGAGAARALGGEVLDLSATGLSLVTRAALQKGKPVHLEFTVRGAEVDAVAEVRWVKRLDGGKSEVGLRFVRIPQTAADAIAREVEVPTAAFASLTPRAVAFA
jgi:hypothetical protein